MTYRNPVPTVDMIIELMDQPQRPIILIERKNSPYGWALPGGFVDYGETVETAARREAREEVNLEIELIEQFHVYSDPSRDPRKHTLSIVFIASAKGKPTPADDAKNLRIFDLWELPENLCFDHDKIIKDYLNYRYYKFRPQLLH